MYMSSLHGRLPGHYRGATASGRSREARARQIARAGKLQDKTHARLKKCARKEKARRR